MGLLDLLRGLGENRSATLDVLSNFSNPATRGSTVCLPTSRLEWTGGTRYTLDPAGPPSSWASRTALDLQFWTVSFTAS
eukprot:4845302-Amphidinium_carterae.1